MFMLLIMLVEVLKKHY